jgi:hypothetical protein
MDVDNVGHNDVAQDLLIDQDQVQILLYKPPYTKVVVKLAQQLLVIKFLLDETIIASPSPPA